MRRIVAWALFWLVLGLAGVGVFYLIEGNGLGRAETVQPPLQTGSPAIPASAPQVTGKAGGAQASAPRTAVERAAQPTAATVTAATTADVELPAAGLPLNETAPALLAAHRGGASAGATPCRRRRDRP